MRCESHHVIENLPVCLRDCPAELHGCPDSKSKKSFYPAALTTHSGEVFHSTHLVVSRWTFENTRLT